MGSYQFSKITPATIRDMPLLQKDVTVCFTPLLSHGTGNQQPEILEYIQQAVSTIYTRQLS